MRCGELRTTVSNSWHGWAGSSCPEVAGKVPSRRCGGFHSLFWSFSSCGSLVCSKARLAGLLFKSRFTLKRKKENNNNNQGLLLKRKRNDLNFEMTELSPTIRKWHEPRKPF